MDTGKIRSFAVAAREQLIVGVDARLDALGFAADGSVPEENRPVKVEGGVKFRGEVLGDASFFGKWTQLESDIRHYDQHRKAGQKTGREMVRDAAAYTWFNRLCAIRILSKRGFISPVLEYVGDKDARTPALVAAMRAGEPQNHLTSDARARLARIRFDDAKTTEQFAILVTAFCRTNQVLHACFGSVLDYTDLLLPHDILAPGGFVDALNDPEVVSDDDYRRDELIGWLYQYYISDRKRDVFDSFKAGKKAEAEDIPAATEIFTPNWIVKYMVENSLGRLAIENGLGGDFVKDWRYLIPVGRDVPVAPHLRIDSPEDLTFADLACGSGHILLEGFRHLMEVYVEAGYLRRQAIEHIFSENLLGIDLDSRARQLSQFALLLAAMSADPSFADAHVLPRVLDMEGTLGEGEFRRGEIAEVLSVQEDSVLDELCGAFALLAEAHNLGSLMKFGLSERTRDVLAARVAELEGAATSEWFSLSAKYLPSFRLILALTARYAALAMNPPYMGAGNMNARLKKYLETNYKDSKSDLMTAFMEVAMARCAIGGRIGMITMQSWMFLSSFETLRKRLLEDCTILSMAHLGARAFDSIGGEVTQTTTFILDNEFRPGFEGTYCRLVDGRSEAEKRDLFLDSNYGRYEADQRSFAKIPGSPIAYWVGEATRRAFEFPKLEEVADPRTGFTTGANELFLRYWHEVSLNKIKTKWFYLNKGGVARKWFGNNDYVVDWENDGFRIKGSSGSTIRNPEYYFREGVTWSKIAADIAGRYSPAECLFDAVGLVCFPKSNSSLQLIHLLAVFNANTASHFLQIINPTLSFSTGPVGKLPMPKQFPLESLEIAKENVMISRADWDEHETSWDFKVNPLVANGRGRTVEAAYRELAETWRARTRRMKELEEENNRLFIDAYGLQDELSPDVPWHRVSLTCNPWYRYGVKEGEEGKPCGVDSSAALEDRLRTDTIKELVSYAVGCLMGRYSLEKEGIIVASGQWLVTSGEKIVASGQKIVASGQCLVASGQKIVASGQCLVARDNHSQQATSHYPLATNHYSLATTHYPLATILPLMAGETAFSDNAPHRVADFVKAAFGEAHLTENLNFIEAALGMSLETYLVRDFWNDHKRTYRNRPIYWLFRSKKGAFQALVYLHRMDAYTASKVRNGYLLPYIEFLRGRIDAETARGAELTAAERTRLKKMKQALEECLEYDGRLHVVADRMQAIDLDDGVVVNYAKFGDVLARIR